MKSFSVFMIEANSLGFSALCLSSFQTYLSETIPEAEEALIEVELIEGKSVLVVFLPSADPNRGFFKI